jgi:DNA-binding CsgD family transcriptional regulator
VVNKGEIVGHHRCPDIRVEVREPSPGATPQPECGLSFALTKQAEPSLTALQSAFGLTAAESRLAIKLATGQALENACAELQVNKETGRSQLKRIFSKLAVNRQHELVAMLSNLLPVPLSRHN